MHVAPVSTGKLKDDSLIEIVGAGSAGLAAGITLARFGRSVVVHEAQAEVGHRFRRDLQGLDNWSTRRDVLAVLEEGVPLAGEKGGFQNALWGFGMRAAITSGVLAARSHSEENRRQPE